MFTGISSEKCLKITLSTLLIDLTTGTLDDKFLNLRSKRSDLISPRNFVTTSSTDTRVETQLFSFWKKDSTVICTCVEVQFS